MASDKPDNPRGTFFGAFTDGARGALGSLRDIFTPGNTSEAASQAGDVGRAVFNPRRSGRSIGNAVDVTRQQAQRGEVDVPNTTAHVMGDVFGAFAATAVVAGLGVRMARDRYLRTRTGSAAHAWSTQQVGRVPPSFMPFVPRPPVARYLATRPLALGMGLIVGGAMVIGGATQRAAAARQNRIDHPEQAAALEHGGLERPLSTPVSRIRRKT